MKGFIMALNMFAIATSYACETELVNSDPFLTEITTSDQYDNPLSPWGVEDETYQKGKLICSICGIIISYYTLTPPASIVAYTICGACAAKAQNDLYDSKYQMNRPYKK